MSLWSFIFNCLLQYFEQYPFETAINTLNVKNKTKFVFKCIYLFIYSKVEYNISVLN